MYNLPNIIFRRVSHLVEHHCLDMTAVLFKFSYLRFDSMYKLKNLFKRNNKNDKFIVFVSFRMMHVVTHEMYLNYLACFFVSIKTVMVQVFYMYSRNHELNKEFKKVDSLEFKLEFEKDV